MIYLLCLGTGFYFGANFATKAAINKNTKWYTLKYLFGPEKEKEKPEEIQEIKEENPWYNSLTNYWPFKKKD